MKRKFEILRETLDEFAQQDEFPVLLVECRSQELAYVLNFMQSLEHSLPGHLVAAFPQRFTAPGPWLDAVAEAVRVQLDYAAPERAERGDAPAPPLPQRLLDSRVPAAERLDALLRYLVALLPNPSDYRLLVGLTPLECDDPQAFAELVASAVPQREVPKWMTPLRLLAWDLFEHAPLSELLNSWPAETVLRYREDFSTQALSDALGREASDRSQDLDARMAAALQLAGLDVAHGRHADAVDKYAAAHEHYYQTGQPELQALTLLGAGDALNGAGDLIGARMRLQQGIAVAMEHRSLPVLVQLLLSVSKVSLALGEHAEAESYAESGTKVAAAAVNPFAYCDFWKRRGDAQAAQGRAAEAIASYDKAREQCAVNEYFDTWLEALDAQAALYAEVGMHAEERALADERELVLARREQSPRHVGGAPG